MQLTILAAVLCTFPLIAQNPVSPANRATSPGNASSSLPFGATGARRYQEIHSTVPGGTTIRGLSWRQDEGNGTFTGTRALDMELTMGRAVRADICRFTFGFNYVSAPTVVMARRVVDFGPQGAAGSPSAFQGMSVVLDAPFVFTSGSLAWEAKVFANAAAGVFANADAEAFPLDRATDGISGVGCTAAGAQDPMRLDATSFGVGLGTYYAHFVRAAPPSAPLVLAIGASNPNLPVPGLCCNLFTDLLTTLAVGSTGVDGAYTSSGATVFFVQRNLVGQTLHAQAFAFDATSTHAIPLLGSNGAVTTFAAPTVFPDVTRIYAEGDANAIAAPFTTDSLGFGLVTRFDT